MTTIYGCYFTSIDETDWFATRKAAELHGSTSGDEFIMRESVGYAEDL